MLMSGPAKNRPGDVGEESEMNMTAPSTATEIDRATSFDSDWLGRRTCPPRLACRSAMS